MNRIVVRPRVQAPLLVVVFAAWALLGLTLLTDGDAVNKPDWFALALGCISFITGAAGIWRAVRLGVVVGAEGLRIRSFDSRDQVFAWQDIDAIECGQIDERAGLPLHAAVLQVQGKGTVVVRALGSCSRSGAAHRVEQLRDFKAAAASSAAAGSAAG